MKRTTGLYCLNILLCLLSLSIFTGCEETLVEKIILDQTSATLKVGDVLNLTATVIPSDADNRALVWSSSNGSVAAVVDGKVAAIAEGNATITATATDGSGVSASCEVKVVLNSNNNLESGDDIQGHWVVLDCDYKEYVDGELVYEEYEVETEWGYYFDENGVLYEFDFDFVSDKIIGDYTFHGRYNYQNGKLEITAYVDDDGRYELISLTSSKMMLSLTWEWMEDGVRYKDVKKYTLQKIDLKNAIQKTDICGYWRLAESTVGGLHVTHSDFSGFRFDEDGGFYKWSCKNDDYVNVELDYQGSYKYQNGKLRMYNLDGREDMVFEVPTLTFSDMVLQIANNVAVDDKIEENVAKITYKRVYLED